MWLEVEGAELVHAPDHLGVASQHLGSAVHEPVQVQDAVLLVSQASSGERFQVVRRCKDTPSRGAAPAGPRGRVSSPPLGDQGIGRLLKLQVENGSPWSVGRDSATCLTWRRCASAFASRQALGW